MSDRTGNDGGVTRLSFIKASAGVATGAAIAAVPAAAAGIDEPGATVTEPTTQNPREPVMAYVRDAERAEVTVMAGTRERTYRDPALVKRLMKAAPERLGATEGGVDVLAP